ncbi:hypothetical protein Y032_0028g1731 [Ancylostoma ceylanicum]|uniref:Uncharacterized protein n=3 Tax=Ancylostoma ceylanicum TaxID=53326 RepID=A0A016UUR4_9BILA|nr:hypothetical protein Y032_0028g1731 [Ancylostoma ceylanicum]
MEILMSVHESNRVMYIQKGDLLNIHQSASKPSLLSSYWSIHVQVQNSDRLDVDVKSCSQSSLPDAFEVKSNSLRGTKSLSDLAMEMTQERTCLSSRDVAMAVDETTAAAAGPDNLTNRITEWLTAIDIQEHKQNV